jgi:hypothetical protein
LKSDPAFPACHEDLMMNTPELGSSRGQSDAAREEHFTTAKIRRKRVHFAARALVLRINPKRRRNTYAEIARVTGQ